MSHVVLELPAQVHRALVKHLLPAGPKTQHEEAAFVFAHGHQNDDGFLLRFAAWEAVPAERFVTRSSGYLELNDACRAGVIKRAHDLGASIVEFHSHTGPYPAVFSPSDQDGLAEFVAHAWWRLKGKPYGAVVVAASGFDGVAWITGPDQPEPLSGIRAGRRLLRATGRSLQRWGNRPWTWNGTIGT